MRQAADETNARVTLLGINRGSFGAQPFVKSDSNANADIRDLEFPAVAAAIAERALDARDGVRARRAHRRGRAAAVLPRRRDGAPPARLGRGLLRAARGRRRRTSSSSATGSSSPACSRSPRRCSPATSSRGRSAAASRGWRASRGASAPATSRARFPVDRDDELGRLAGALDEMQRQLAELDTARRGFIATASHELRTPIFSLGGFLELLEDEDLDEETRAGFMAQLRLQVDRLGKLTTDLLDLSRLEAGADRAARPRRPTSSGSPRPSPPSSRPRSPRTSPSSSCGSATSRSPLVCDPERVAQILRILLDNALAHTPAGTDVLLDGAARATAACGSR